MASLITKGFKNQWKNLKDTISNQKAEITEKFEQKRKK
jgi:hypothetical protein